MKKNQLLVSILTLALSSVGLMNTSIAGNITATQKATATLASSCAFSIQDLSFGTFSPSPTGNVDASTTVTSTCSKGINYTIVMDSFHSVCNNRYMNSVSGNGSVLYYNVYTDASRSTIWSYNQAPGAGGSCVAGYGGSYASLTGTGDAQTTTAYGRMSANQFVPPGNYSDTMNVALYF